MFYSFWKITGLYIVFLSIIISFNYFFRVYSCQRRAEIINADYKYDIITGCMVSNAEGKWSFLPY
jgi:hypothetical protein